MTMRIPALASSALSPELRAVHDNIASLMAHSQPEVISLDSRGALIGPFPVMLHFPKFGIPALTFQRAVSAEPQLAKTVREVAILATGAAFGARYEVYAHEITGRAVGLTAAQVAVLASGGRPGDLSDAEGIAYEFARVMSTGRIVPASTFSRAQSILGHDGVGELAFLVSGYGMLAMLMNAFDVPVPDAEA